MKLLLKNCDILASGDDGFYVIKNGYLGISGDTVDYIGSKRPAAQYDSERDMTDKLLMPGLINTHTHTPMCLLRGVGSDLPLDKWLFDTIFPIEDRMTAADVEAGSAMAILEMLACGTTSFSDMYMNPEKTAELVIASGIKANLCRPVQSFDPNEDPKNNTRLKESIEFIKNYNNSGEGRILTDFSIHAEYTCTEKLARAYGEICASYGGNMHVHLSETEKEHRECVEKYGVTPAEWFNNSGVFDAGAFAAHCVTVTDADLELFKEKGVSVVHNPTSNMKLASGFAPIQKMMDMGINVGLGTDGAASNNNLNMFEEMHIAAIIHKGYLNNPVVVSPENVLRMATVNGARIQRRDDTGELKTGMKADIIAIDLDAPHLLPVNDHPSLIVYTAQASDVCMTMVNGRILYENGEYKTLDKEKIYADFRSALKKLYI